ncbi:hypothetical protein ZOSMA_57G00030 [Zostera marina]|uniref:Transmembrane 9 superfamily member n=1 Tax=Zostera marina TaxID=29655 RepID=A0A0K9NVL5_ZOSMR|nr:hypothetical protein ZOSMA_57G00030 [Zostera marina]
MMVAFFARIVLIIFLPTVHWDLKEYDKELQTQMNEKLSGWKLVVGNVFRIPTNPLLLCNSRRQSSMSIVTNLNYVELCL